MTVSRFDHGFWPMCIISILRPPLWGKRQESPGANFQRTVLIECHTQIALPLGFSPSAMHCLAHPDGEKATSRAAAKMNIPMALSTYSTTSIEDVKQEGGDNPTLFS